MDNCNQTQHKGKLHLVPNFMGLFALSYHERNSFSELDLETGQVAVENDTQFVVLSAATIHSLWIHPFVFTLHFAHFTYYCQDC